jgi:hypothetical protein
MAFRRSAAMRTTRNAVVAGVARTASSPPRQRPTCR